MGQHEDRVVEGRIIAPPALPRRGLLVTPGRSEHVPAHDGGPDATLAREEKIVVGPGCTAGFADHLFAGLGLEDPLMQLFAAHSQRVFHGLVGAGGITVQGDGEIVDAQLGHRSSCH
jgi:hypothetical protein